MDFTGMTKLLAASCERQNVHHVVLREPSTKWKGPSFTMPFPDDIVRMCIEPRLKFLESHAFEHQDIVFVEADCLVGPCIHHAFGADYEIGMVVPKWPDNPAKGPTINGGVFYCPARHRNKAAHFFRRALEIVKPKWGGDQEAFGIVLGTPFPPGNGIHQCEGFKVALMDGSTFNLIPKTARVREDNVAVVHFKGDRKIMMRVVFDTWKRM